LLPADCIQVRIAGSVAVPVWLGVEDYPWLRALIDDFARLDGRRYGEAVSFLQEPPRTPAPSGKRRMAMWTMQNLCERERPPFDAGLFRDAVTVAAQRARDAGQFDRSEVLAAGARILGLPCATAEDGMFADLPGERRLRVPNPLPEPQALASRTNLALAQGLLRLASEVAIEMYGGARAVMRQVRLRRLLCTARRVGPEGVRLEVSGPFSLFRHTTMYGRALASILPFLPWCTRYDLEARCMIRGESVSVRLLPGDPIAGGEAPRTYDSRLEERFARDFARASLDWDLVREPEPVEAGEFLAFPDFAVVHRHDMSKRFLLEIVGFWTPDYLREKLARLRAMPHIPLVLCIDRGLNCSGGELPPHARVVWFQRRIDPVAVLAAIEEGSQEFAISVERIGLGDLFIDWAGRLPPSDAVHGRIATRKVGEEVRLRKHGPGIAIEVEDGPIAMLSRPACDRWVAVLDRVLSVTLVELAQRQAAQSAPRWRSRLRCDRWAVPVVDVRFATQAGSFLKHPGGSLFGHGSTLKSAARTPASLIRPLSPVSRRSAPSKIQELLAQTGI
jgi:predicted nuclease of restriction endonuclease-like RecB superfamily